MNTVRTLTRNSHLISRERRDFEIQTFPARDDSGQVTTHSHRFLVQGGLHGNEQLSTKFVRWLAKRYAQGQSQLNKLPQDQVAIDFLPAINPDGTARNSRYNSRGVNLNRNFSVLWGASRENPGTTAFSERETRAIRELFRVRKYTAAVDVHGYVRWIVAPSRPSELAKLGSTIAQNRDTSWYTRWLAKLKRAMRVLPGYRLKTAGELGDGGAFEDWAFWRQGTLSYCLELQNEERFSNPYRRMFDDIRVADSRLRVDNFLRYEHFVYRNFVHAMTLRPQGWQQQVADN